MNGNVIGWNQIEVRILMCDQDSVSDVNPCRKSCIRTFSSLLTVSKAAPVSCTSPYWPLGERCLIDLHVNMDTHWYKNSSWILTGFD